MPLAGVHGRASRQDAPHQPRRDLLPTPHPPTKKHQGRQVPPHHGDGKTRNRPSVRGKTKTEAKDNLDKLRDEINAGIRTPATYTIEQCVKDWLDSIERDPHTMETITGQAKNWIYPRIGATKLRDFTATDADRFFKSKRSLILPKRAIIALKAHKARQDRERREAGEAWHANNLVFCHENGTPYTSDALNWRFAKVTREPGIGHWHAHEGRHTAVSIMSSNGVPIQVG
jgi:integrase